MTTQTWLIYLILVIVATASPGPAVIFIMTNATLYGWKKALSTCPQYITYFNEMILP